MRLEKRDMLLFCKEKSARTNYLYFVEFGTLDDLSPRIHRYTVGLLAFETFDLSCVYGLSVVDVRILSSVLSGIYALEDDDYLMLMELRELRFGDPNSPRSFQPSDYYTFEETRSILAYRDPLKKRVPLLLLRLCVYAAALLIPFVLYVLLLVAALNPDSLRGSPVTGPLFAIGALPFTVYAMALLFTLATLWLLNWPPTRYEMLKQYVLRGAGKRKSVVLSSGERIRRIRTGIASLGIAVFFLLIHLIF